MQSEDGGIAGARAAPTHTCSSNVICLHMLATASPRLCNADMDWQASLTPVRQARPVSRTGKRKSPAQHRTPVDESVIDLCDEDGAAGPGASATSSSFMHAHGRSTALTGRGQQANFGAKRQHNSRTTEQSIAQAGAGGSQQVGSCAGSLCCSVQAWGPSK